MLPGESASPCSPDLGRPQGRRRTVVAASRAPALAEAEHEYRRLLYVAMTRAAERLIVCGAEGERGAAQGLLVRSRPRGAASRLWSKLQDGDDKVWRYRKPADDVSNDNTPPATAAPTVRGKIPAWLRSNAPVEIPTCNAAFAFGRLR